MKKTKISDVIIDKISGEWGEEVNGEPGVKILRTTNFTNDGFLNLENVVERKIKPELVEKKKLIPGDVIIEKSGGSPNQPVGRVVYFNETDADYLCNNFTAILRPSKKIHPKYFFYALFYLHLSKGTLRYQNKTTGILNLKLERYLDEETIPLPDLKTQQEIAHVLEQADKARQQRKAANELTDQFLQSSFLLLFGDPVKNEKGWDLKTLPELAKKEKYSLKRGPFGGALKKEIFIDKGYLVYEQYHAINDDFSMARYFIDENKYQELIAFVVKPGDLIVSCSGVTLGRIAELPKDAKPGIINQALLKISLDPNVIVNSVFKFLFRQQGFQDKLFEFSRGSGIPNFPPMTTINSIKFVCPPLFLQQQFAGIVAQAEQLRQKQRESERELEGLFQGLLQRYFG